MKRVKLCLSTTDFALNIGVSYFRVDSRIRPTLMRQYRTGSVGSVRNQWCGYPSFPFGTPITLSLLQIPALVLVSYVLASSHR